jgi:hypothetical protein
VLRECALRTQGLSWRVPGKMQQAGTSSRKVLQLHCAHQQTSQGCGTMRHNPTLLQTVVADDCNTTTTSIEQLRQRTAAQHSKLQKGAAALLRHHQAPRTSAATLLRAPTYCPTVVAAMLHHNTTSFRWWGAAVSCEPQRLQLPRHQHQRLKDGRALTRHTTGHSYF